MLSLVAGGVVALDEPVPAAPKVTAVASPLPPNVGYFLSLRGVTCVTPTDCFAVGYYTEKDTGLDKTMVERWNGTTWSIVDSPNPVGEPYSHLAAITCVSSTSCVAVGNSSPYPDDDNLAPVNTLAEQWDGTTWQVVPTPRFPLDSNFPYRYLTSVACTASTNCFAVGYATNGLGYRTLVLQWDGSTWTIVPSPNRVAPHGGPQVLSSVTCLTSTNCFAVGNAHVGNERDTVNRDVTLVEHWNGTSWKLVPSPNATKDSPPLGNFLQAVTCTASNSCIATGYYGKYDGTDGRSRTLTLVERWNGTSWKIVPSPTPTGDRRRNRLSSVSCTSSTDCLAVGSGLNAEASNTLLEHWNGKKWSIVTSPTFTGRQFISLDGVACTTVACFAVGQRYVWHSNNWTPLVMRYS